MHYLRFCDWQVFFARFNQISRMTPLSADEWGADPVPDDAHIPLPQRFLSTLATHPGVAPARCGSGPANGEKPDRYPEEVRLGSGPTRPPKVAGGLTIRTPGDQQGAGAKSPIGNTGRHRVAPVLLRRRGLIALFRGNNLSCFVLGYILQAEAAQFWRVGSWPSTSMSHARWGA